MANALPTIACSSSVDSTPFHNPLTGGNGEISSTPALFKTCSGAVFTCEVMDVDRVKSLFCSLADSIGSHVMEGKGEVSGDIFQRAFKISWLTRNYIVQTENGSAADWICALKHGEMPDALSIHHEKNRECDRINVVCAGEKGGVTCGMTLPLSQLPGHWSSECHTYKRPRPGQPPRKLAEQPSGSVTAHNAPSRSAGELSAETELPNRSDEPSTVEQNLSRQSSRVDNLRPDTEPTLRIVAQGVRLAAHETTRYNGRLIWPIDQYTRRMGEAVSGEKTCLFSQPFYSSPTGYKMSARLFLNGDSIGRGTHMSLYFMVMKGECDERLDWPFQHRVLFKLYDQSANERHVIQSITPDPSDIITYGRPSEPKNRGVGLPLFVEQGLLSHEQENYVLDDIMFVGVEVLSEGLSEKTGV